MDFDSFSWRRHYRFLALSGGGMAFLHRLVLFFLLVGSSSVFAVIPTTVVYQSASYSSYLPGQYATPGALCSAEFSLIQGWWSGQGVLASCEPSSASIYRTDPANPINVAHYVVNACPANSVAAGSSCACESPYVENSGHTACVMPPTNCPVGNSVSATVGVGWYPPGTSSITYMQAVAVMGLCVANGAYKCSTSSASMNMAYVKAGSTANSVTADVSATLDGAECTGPVTPATVMANPPPCVGQSGTVNGLTVCLPAESDASKLARASSAAAAASAAASAFSAAAGATPAAAAAAGAAAGAAASSVVMGGGSMAVAAAAGSAAGAASASAAAAGKSTNEAAAAAAGAASAKTAGDTAAAAAAAAGLSTATVAAASAAAAEAAKAASDASIANGQSAAAAAAAAKAAGDAAASSVAAAAKAAGDAAAAAAAAAGKNALEQAAAAKAASDAAAVAADTAAKAAKAAVDAAAAAAAKAASDAANKPDPISKFCTDNPTAALCRKAMDSKFSSACGSAPICEGDAIQCAMASEQFTRNCQLYNPDVDPNSAVNKALSGADGMNTDKMKSDAAGSPVDVGTFNTSGSGWGRGCPSDPIVAISWAGGQSFTVPFSRLCGPLGLLANAAVALTLIGSLMWVVGGYKVNT
jgi:hypothetical protein